MKWFDDWRATKLIRNSCHRAALAALPPGLEAYWKHSAPQEYKGIWTDAFFFLCAAEGLMNFFDIVTRSGKPCALPSEAADSVWHAWLRWNPSKLDYFCIEHFGRKIPHIERADLARGALLNSFVACRRRDSDAIYYPLRLPALFRLDARLKMCGGHGYWNGGLGFGDIVYARIGARGQGRQRASLHPELTAHAVKAALLAKLRRAAPRRTGGVTMEASTGTLGDAASFAFLDSDAGANGCDGSADAGGGCDSGSSCGSSCGGGCGGGGD